MIQPGWHKINYQTYYIIFYNSGKCIIKIYINHLFAEILMYQKIKNYVFGRLYI